MSLLAMTPPIVAAIKNYQKAGGSLNSLQKDSDPSLANARTGRPISYGQLIDLCSGLNGQTPGQGDEDSSGLSDLLRGSSIYEGQIKQKDEPVRTHHRLVLTLDS